MPLCPEAQKFRVIHPSQYIIFISIILLLRVIPGAFIDQSWWMWVGYAYYCAAFLGVQCYFDAVILPHNARVVDTIEGILQQHNQEQLHRNYMLECPPPAAGPILLVFSVPSRLSPAVLASWRCRHRCSSSSRSSYGYARRMDCVWYVFRRLCRCGGTLGRI